VSIQRKTEVLSIKTTPEIKGALKAIGDREHRSMANTLETLVLDYFSRNGLEFPRPSEGAPKVATNTKNRRSK
jgi:hypothetical protein